MALKRQFPQHPIFILSIYNRFKSLLSHLIPLIKRFMQFEGASHMTFTLNQNPSKQQQQNLLKIKKQMQGLQNEMEFVEILTQFWPLPNMAKKMERLEQRMELLNRQYTHYSALKAS